MMRVGFIGKKDISIEEQFSLQTIGCILAQMGHTLVTTDSPGSNRAVLKGVVDEAGRTDIVKSNVSKSADITIIYADEALAKRLDLAGISAGPDIIIMSTSDDLDYFTDEAVVAAYRNNLDI